jgi:hypothetical protein
MDPRELVTLLLDARETSASRFLIDNQMSELQPTFSKWLSGKTRNPRKEWADRVARALQIKPAAMLDESIADEEAARLGVVVMRRSSGASMQFARRPRQARIDAGMLVVQIADLMRGYDQDTRESAAPLFKIAATQPNRAAEMADKLRALLAEPTPAPSAADALGEQARVRSMRDGETAADGSDATPATLRPLLPP